MTRFVALIALLAIVSGPCAADDQADIEWAEQHFSAALDAAFPIASGSSVVFVRGYHDLHHSFPEFSIAITWSPQTGRLSALTRTAMGASLFHQLSALHQAHPDITPEAAVAQLHLSTRNVSDQECPAVSKAFAAFQRLRFAPPDLDTIVIHPVIYQLRVAGSGTLSYTLYEPDQSLRRWAQTTLDRIGACKGTT